MAVSEYRLPPEHRRPMLLARLSEVRHQILLLESEGSPGSAAEKLRAEVADLETRIARLPRDA